MFFGNSRISFIKNLTSILGELGDNNYVITFIDEAVTDYSNNTGTVVGSRWNDDVDDFRLVMENKNINSFVVFDIETTAGNSDYIWAENSDTSLPFPEQNLVKIFRPNAGTQQEFYQTVLANLESRWGTGVWSHMASNGLKFIIVIDNSGSMGTSLIQGALSSLTEYLNGKGVENYVLEGCANERWLAWAASAYHDAENAGCSGTCNWGTICSFKCTDTNSDCFGNSFELCIPTYAYSNGSIVLNSCPDCSTINFCPQTSNISVSCTSCTGTTGTVCGDCDIPQLCNTCSSASAGNFFHKCVKCHYLDVNEVFNNPPTFTYGGITTCGIAHCGVTSGTTFGATSWDGSSWSWINAVPGFTGPPRFGNTCYTNFEDDNGNCGVCPVYTDNGDVLWLVEVCDDGCSHCGATSYMPVASAGAAGGGISSIDSTIFNLCLQGCTA